VIRRHADRFGIDKDELITVYGWDPRRLAHDAEHQYTEGCNYCREQYAGMGRGFADITLDIQDRNRPPYYLTNTKWCCQACNRKKGARSPEEFELDRQVWTSGTGRKTVCQVNRECSFNAGQRWRPGADAVWYSRPGRPLPE
jgi:hypothetical protein